MGSQYDASQCICKNSTNFYSSAKKKSARHRATFLGKNVEPTSSEIHDAPRHIVNPPLLMSIISSIYSVVSNTVYIMYVCMCVCVHKCAGRI